MTSLGACRRELDRGKLVRVMPDWGAGSVKLNAVFASGRAAKPAARAFTEYLAGVLDGA
jgi:DNA-binding transcriptional LysR family regulator